MSMPLTALAQRFFGRLRLHRRHVLYAFGIAVLLLASSVGLYRISPYESGSHTGQYFRATVVAVRVSEPSGQGPVQNIQARLLDGPQKSHVIRTTRGIDFGDAAAKRLPVGSTILLFRGSGSGAQYSFISRWYMPGLATLLIILIALVVVIGAWRGITSIFGLAISVGVLALFVVPRIVAGHNAFATCIEGAVAITLISVYVAHGLSRRTTVALAGSLITLAAVVGLTGLASYVTGTSEIITEDSVGIFYAAHAIDVAGLLTGGVIIASLGTLFDITTAQAAIADELHKTDPKLSTEKLFWKSMSVGREHLAALINTLALVYVGVALPAIVTTIVLNTQYNYHVPLAVSLNTETIAEEVVRTCVASIGMLVALPITSWLAAYILPRWSAAASRR